MEQPTIEAWARSLNISSAPTPPAVAGYDEPLPFSAREIATRASSSRASSPSPMRSIPSLLSTGIATKASGSRSALKSRASYSIPPRSVRMLGITCGGIRRPSGRCCGSSAGSSRWDCRPAAAIAADWWTRSSRHGLGIEAFLASAELRSPGVLLAEDDRHYDLWCRYIQARREGPYRLPRDLDAGVLYQRRYAFEWLQGIEA